MEEQYKICLECGEEKSSNEFPADKRAKDGRRNKCSFCHNKYIRSLRKIGVEENLVKSSTKFTSELDTFRREIKYFSDSFDKSDELDIDFISSFLEKAAKFHEIARFPPINKFNICDLGIEGGGPLFTNISIISSKLTIFFAMRKNITEVNIKILQDERYNKNHKLEIILPKDILLTRNEIKEFEDSLFPLSVKKGKNFIEINEDGVDLSPMTKEVPNLVRDIILKNCGLEINPIKVKISYQNMDNITVKWEKKYLIDDDVIQKIKEEIYSYIIVSI
jgi:hypothetical protein